MIWFFAYFVLTVLALISVGGLLHMLCEFGEEMVTPPRPCPHCDGSGVIIVSPETTRVCEFCQGLPDGR